VLGNGESLFQAAVRGAQGERSALWRCLMLLMLDVLEPLRGTLPAVGSNALGIAIEYWRHASGSVEDLMTAKVECWAYLDSKHPSTVIADREDRALRALLCVLEPSGDEGTAEQASEWFEGMLRGLSS